MELAQAYGHTVQCDPVKNLQEIGVGIIYSFIENILLRPGAIVTGLIFWGFDPGEWLDRVQTVFVETNIEYSESFYIGQIIGNAIQGTVALVSMLRIIAALSELLASYIASWGGYNGGQAYAMSVSGAVQTITQAGSVSGEAILDAVGEEAAIAIAAIIECTGGKKPSDVRRFLEAVEESSKGDSDSKIPQKAKDALDKIDKDSEGYLEDYYYGGVEFKNRPNTKIGETKISNKNITNYTEYDINPYKYGKSRDTERVVVGLDGSAWYTPDHYKTWYQIR